MFYKELRIIHCIYSGGRSQNEPTLPLGQFRNVCICDGWLLFGAMISIARGENWIVIFWTGRHTSMEMPPLKSHLWHYYSTERWLLAFFVMQVTEAFSSWIPMQLKINLSSLSNSMRARYLQKFCILIRIITLKYTLFSPISGGWCASALPIIHYGLP